VAPPNPAHPLIADGRSRSEFFAQITPERANARVVVHRINRRRRLVGRMSTFDLFTRPDDTGIAGVDITGWMSTAGIDLGHLADRW